MNFLRTESVKINWVWCKNLLKFNKFALHITIPVIDFIIFKELLEKFELKVAHYCPFLHLYNRI